MRGVLVRHTLALGMVLTRSVAGIAPAQTFPIGTPRQKWGPVERAAWLKSRRVTRSYRTEVLDKLDGLTERFEVKKYGALSHDAERYPLYAVKTRNWAAGKPCVLVTGGVHGYELSGVQGAILFLQSKAEEYSELFNILVAPCVSPWGYETIQRWNAQAVDPNRSFSPDGETVEGRSFNPEAATEESAALIALLDTLEVEQWTCHIDLHETTDTDETEVKPATYSHAQAPTTLTGIAGRAAARARLNASRRRLRRSSDQPRRRGMA